MKKNSRDFSDAKENRDSGVSRRRYDHNRKKKEESPKNRLSTTFNAVETGKGLLKYKTTTGYLNIEVGAEKTRSQVFFISYEKTGEKDLSKRPITFAFNGGPGCASIWVNFGVMGPKRVTNTDVDDTPRTPFEFEDNKHTWLEFTDLVFIDPVGTGYSVPQNTKDEKKFWGVKEDLDAIAEFIRLYVVKNNRWPSPKYVSGESYGTTRAAGLTEILHNAYGIDLNGIILISSVLNFITHRFTPGNELPYVLFLPSYTATAWYHKKLISPFQNRELESLLKEVEEWAINEYLPALARGDQLSCDDREVIAERLAAYTGLSLEYVNNSNLRIIDYRFTKELLRAEHRTVGRLDSRFKGIDKDSAGEKPEYDPSFSWGPYVAAVNHHVREELKYENDLPYTFLSQEANQSWKWESLDGNTSVNVAESVRKTVNINPVMKVFVASGYYDLATPYFATDYTLNHLGLDPEMKENIMVKYYKSGHMLYYHLPSLKKFTHEVREFITGSPE